MSSSAPTATSTAQALTADWLAQCAQAIAQDPLRSVHPERWLWAKPPQARLRLPLLLVSGQGAEGPDALRGHRAWLTLALWTRPEPGLVLAPLPASALMPVDNPWQAVMDELLVGLQGLLQPQQALGWAIGWDVGPQAGQGSISALQGRSAAASLTVGALWLLRRWLQQGFSDSSLWPLVCLSQAELECCWISADVQWAQGQPQLRRVDEKGLQAKSQALAAFDATATLHTHQPLDGPLGARVKPAHDWAKLLHQMGAEQGWSLAQARLLWALLSHEGPGAELKLPYDEELLAVSEITVDQASRFDHRQAALRQFARWEHASEGPVTRWHVPLGLAHDESGLIKESLERQRKMLREEQAPEEPDDHRHRLDHVLRYRVKREALVLVGEPGAGKTTLMRHWVQRCCWQALEAWERGDRPEELPLYLPLNELAVDEEPLAWARRHLREHGMQAWVDWALPEAGAHAQRAPPAWIPKAWRWVCDGLNELPHDQREDRKARALKVLQALQAALRQPPARLGTEQTAPLPLLSIRDQHFSHENWLRVLVEPWREEDIQIYLQRRFGQVEGAAHMQTLRTQEGALKLARTPLMLAGLADLLAEGWQTLPSNRAKVYAGWLWLRLRRALGLSRLERVRQLADQDLRSLLSPRDLAKLEDPSYWKDPQRMGDLPLEGVLLGALVLQAEAQYWQDHEQGKARANRCEVAVPWERDPKRPQARPAMASLRSWRAEQSEPSPHPTAQAWGRALAALGLVVIDPLRNEFRFSHQSWGEYLASLRLLITPPDQLRDAFEQRQPVAILRWHRIMAACAAPVVPDPVAELSDQRLALAQRWEAALPPTRREKLLREGLRVSWLEFCADRGIDPATQPQDTRWVQYFADDPAHGPILSLQSEPEGKVMVHANLRAWGERFWLQETFAATVGTRPDERWMDCAVGMHDVIQGWLFACFRQAAWAWLVSNGVNPEQLEALRKEAGYLPGPPVGDTQEVMTLALLGHTDPVPWLLTLLSDVPSEASTESSSSPEVWRAAVPAALLLREELERHDTPLAKSFWDQAFWTNPHPVLQFLRRRLLLCSVDAGTTVRQRLEDCGLLDLLRAGRPAEVGGVVECLSEQDFQRLDQAWQRIEGKAFTSERGVRLQQRIQCGLWLSELGDNLRWERGVGRDPSQHRGVLLRAPLWARVGQPGLKTTYRVGAEDGEVPNEAPTVDCELSGFELAIYPVTVAEYQCFVASGGYEPGQPWWQGEARTWLLANGGRDRRPYGWNDGGRRYALLPVVGLSWWEAQAYAAWAQDLRPLAPVLHPHPVAMGRLSLPSELQMQAAARGPCGAGREDAQRPFDEQSLPSGIPASLAFNHVATRLGRLAPVGVFSLSLSSLGVEQCGNSWAWVRNLAVEDYEGDNLMQALRPADPSSRAERAMVGGSFNYTEKRSRVACRLLAQSRTYIDDVGMRLLVEPHAVDDGA